MSELWLVLQDFYLFWAGGPYPPGDQQQAFMSVVVLDLSSLCGLENRSCFGLQQKGFASEARRLPSLSFRARLHGDSICAQSSCGVSVSIPIL